MEADPAAPPPGMATTRRRHLPGLNAYDTDDAASTTSSPAEDAADVPRGRKRSFAEIDGDGGAHGGLACPARPAVDANAINFGGFCRGARRHRRRFGRRAATRSSEAAETPFATSIGRVCRDHRRPAARFGRYRPPRWLPALFRQRTARSCPDPPARGVGPAAPRLVLHIYCRGRRAFFCVEVLFPGRGRAGHTARTGAPGQVRRPVLDQRQGTDDRVGLASRWQRRVEPPDRPHNAGQGDRAEPRPNRRLLPPRPLPHPPPRRPPLPRPAPRPHCRLPALGAPTLARAVRLVPALPPLPRSTPGRQRARAHAAQAAGQRGGAGGRPWDDEAGGAEDAEGVDRGQPPAGVPSDGGMAGGIWARGGGSRKGCKSGTDGVAARGAPGGSQRCAGPSAEMEGSARRAQPALRAVGRWRRAAQPHGQKCQGGHRRGLRDAGLRVDGGREQLPRCSPGRDLPRTTGSPAPGGRRPYLLLPELPALHLGVSLRRPHRRGEPFRRRTVRPPRPRRPSRHGPARLRGRALGGRRGKGAGQGAEGAGRAARGGADAAEGTERAARGGADPAGDGGEGDRVGGRGCGAEGVERAGKRGSCAGTGGGGTRRGRGTCRGRGARVFAATRARTPAPSAGKVQDAGAASRAGTPAHGAGKAQEEAGAGTRGQEGTRRRCCAERQGQRRRTAGYCGAAGTRPGVFAQGTHDRLPPFLPRHPACTARLQPPRAARAAIAACAVIATSAACAASSARAVRHGTGGSKGHHRGRRGRPGHPQPRPRPPSHPDGPGADVLPCPRRRSAFAGAADQPDPGDRRAIGGRRAWRQPRHGAAAPVRPAPAAGEPAARRRRAVRAGSAAGAVPAGPGAAAAPAGPAAQRSAAVGAAARVPPPPAAGRRGIPAGAGAPAVAGIREPAARGAVWRPGCGRSGADVSRGPRHGCGREPAPPGRDVLRFRVLWIGRRRHSATVCAGHAVAPEPRRGAVPRCDVTRVHAWARTGIIFAPSVQ